MSYPVSEPFDQGVLRTTDGHAVWWERVGNPAGKPAVVLHGGPGSGVNEWWRTFFDPERYAVTLFDQRGCGRSRPLASDADADLSTITTATLISDIEALRELHGVDRWLVFGVSWGSTLGLAYAVTHPERVSEMVLWGVVTTTATEVDWLTWTMGEVYPEVFAELRSVVPEAEDGENLPAAVLRELMSDEPERRDRAAVAWCDWEDRLAAVDGPPSRSPRFEDPVFRLGFARLVTHVFAHAAFLAPDAITGHLNRLRDVPIVMVRGRRDIASPLGPAWRIAQALPLATLHVVEDEGHGGQEQTNALLVRALDAFASD